MKIKELVHNKIFQMAVIALVHISWVTIWAMSMYDLTLRARVVQVLVIQILVLILVMSAALGLQNLVKRRRGSSDISDEKPAKRRENTACALFAVLILVITDIGGYVHFSPKNMDSYNQSTWFYSAQVRGYDLPDGDYSNPFSVEKYTFLNDNMAWRYFSYRVDKLKKWKWQGIPVEDRSRKACDLTFKAEAYVYEFIWDDRKVTIKEYMSKEYWDQARQQDDDSF